MFHLTKNLTVFACLLLALSAMSKPVIKITKVTGTSIAFSWDKISGANDYFVARNGSMTTTENYFANLPASTTSYEFTNLKKCTFYQITVQPMDAMANDGPEATLVTRTYEKSALQAKSSFHFDGNQLSLMFVGSSSGFCAVPQYHIKVYQDGKLVLEKETSQNYLKLDKYQGLLTAEITGKDAISGDTITVANPEKYNCCKETENETTTPTTSSTTTAIPVTTPAPRRSWWSRLFD